MRPNRVKQALRGGESALGTMIFEFDTTGIARIAAEAGAEFVIFDTEHSGWSIRTVRDVIAASRCAEIVPLVRVPAAQYHLMAPVLDVGAMGLMVPMVETEDQARLVASSALYPPDGRRGAAFGVAHDDYRPGDIVEKMRSANEQMLLIAQIETALGVENVELIAAVEGIDVLWIGHFDLTNSLGIPGQFTHPDYLRCVDRVLSVCASDGKAAGIMASSIPDARGALQQGFRAVAYGGDLWIYQEALRTGLAAIRSS